MSNVIEARPRIIQGKRRFQIVASRFNAEYVQGLLDHIMDELRVLAPGSTIAIQRVPGAFEIPVVVRELAVKKKANVIIAAAVILKGRTSHAEHLGRTVTDALQRIAIDHGVPVINVVLSLENEILARERCLGDKINRGTEAARAAVDIASVMSELRAK